MSFHTKIQPLVLKGIIRFPVLGWCLIPQTNQPTGELKSSLVAGSWGSFLGSWTCRMAGPEKTRPSHIQSYLSNWWFQPPLKNISQLGWLFPIYAKIKNVPNHQPVICLLIYLFIYPISLCPRTWSLTTYQFSSQGKEVIHGRGTRPMGRGIFETLQTITLW